MKIISIDATKCTGCGICQVMCSVSKKGKAQPTQARIRLRRQWDIPEHTLIVCQHCADPACSTACLMETIAKSPETGRVEKDLEQCFGCAACSVMCPIGAPVYDSDSAKVVTCDFCGGDPVCVRVCPQSALTYAEPKDLSVNLREKQARRFFKDTGGVGV